MFLLFLVHCNRPFVGPVYEFILALVRNVRNGSKGELAKRPDDRSKKRSFAADMRALLGYRTFHQEDNERQHQHYDGG